MRILVVTRGVVPIQPGAGGAELAAYQASRELGRRGHRVVLVSDVIDEPQFASENVSFRPIDSALLRRVKVFPAGFFRWIVEHLIGNVAAARAARRVARREGPFDIVNVNGALAARLVKRWIPGVPVVYTEQDATPWLCRYRRWWERAIRKTVYRLVNVPAFRRVDHVATVFDSLRDELVDRYRIPASKVTTIVNATDADLFNPNRPGRSLVREEFGFDRYVLFVGRLTARKAPDLLVRALADVTDVNCAFVGDGPMRRKLERLAVELGVADRVAFVGNLAPAELGRVYADADLTVLPSVSEGMPLVVIESMACGTPVLTTRVAGSENLIEDWETGFLVRPGDLGQLEMAVRFLWGDRALRARMGEKAREKAIESFLWPVVGERYLILYHSLMVEQQAPPQVPASSGVLTLSA